MSAHTENEGQQTTEKDDECAEVLRAAANSPRNPMRGLRGVMVVTDSPPPVAVPEFPPQAFTCPHGVTFWTYPDGQRVAALRDLNYPPRVTPPGADPSLPSSDLS